MRQQRNAPEVRAIIDLLVDAVPSAYNGRPKLFPLMVMKAVNFSLRERQHRPVELRLRQCTR